MKRRALPILLICLSLIASCALGASFNELLGIPEGVKIPNLEESLGAAATLEEEAPDEFAGDCYRFDYPSPDAAMSMAESFYNDMTVAGFTGSSLTVQGMNGILLEKDGASALLLPVGDAVYVILGEGKAFTQEYAEPQPAVMPNPNESFAGARATDYGDAELEYGFTVSAVEYVFDNPGDSLRAAAAFEGEMTALGWRALYASVDGEQATVFWNKGCRVILYAGDGVVQLGVERDAPITYSGEAESPSHTEHTNPQPTTEPTPTASPAPEASVVGDDGAALLPSFGAFIGWGAPAESFELFKSDNGVSVMYDVYYGFDKALALEYIELLRDPRYRLSAVGEVETAVDKDGYTAIGASYAYSGEALIGPAWMEHPVTGEGCHIIAGAAEKGNAAFTLLYPSTVRFVDFGDRSRYYGTLYPGEPIPIAEDNGGSTGGGSQSSECALCGGDGVCYRCNGSGVEYTLQGKMTCVSCNGSGVCVQCHGKGR